MSVCLIWLTIYTLNDGYLVNHLVVPTCERKSNHNFVFYPNVNGHVCRKQ